MKQQIWMAVGLISSGLLLVAAAMDAGLPVDYWHDDMQATIGAAPHDWSKLESSLQPQACAQCHHMQFKAWKKSLHAQAYSSGMIGQFADMGHAAANNCLDCHAPLQEQLYLNDADMHRSIALRLARSEIVDGEGDQGDEEADGEGNAVPLRHSGVSCAVCHVRGWQRFGPPPRTAPAEKSSAAHGGFTATRAFESSQFCASCHQFPASMAINGKPLENTFTEWKQSSFSKKGITCQQCHMPGRRHEFRGIHDAAMVRKGLSFDLSQDGNNVVFNMTSIWIGHAFPTYVTPKVLVQAEAKDESGRVLRAWQWEIMRQVEYNNGWQEIQDTRLMPGESRRFVVSDLPVQANRVLYRVKVMPDYFYQAVYQDLLAGQSPAALKDIASQHIRRADKQANDNDYLLYEKELVLAPLR